MFEDVESLALCNEPDADDKSSTAHCPEALALSTETSLSVISVAETVSNEPIASQKSNAGRPLLN